MSSSPASADQLKAVETAQTTLTAKATAATTAANATRAAVTAAQAAATAAAETIDLSSISTAASAALQDADSVTTTTAASETATDAEVAKWVTAANTANTTLGNAQTELDAAQTALSTALSAMNNPATPAQLEAVEAAQTTLTAKATAATTAANAANTAVTAAQAAATAAAEAIDLSSISTAATDALSDAGSLGGDLAMAYLRAAATANHATANTPPLTVWAQAGITGVTADNLATINSLLNTGGITGVDNGDHVTVSELQAMVTAYLQVAAGADNTQDNDTLLDAAQLTALGLGDVINTTQETTLFNDVLDQASSSEVDTGSKLSALANTVQKIMLQATGGGQTISEAEFDQLGMDASTLTAAQASALLMAIANAGGAGNVDTLAKLTALIDNSSPTVSGVAITSATGIQNNTLNVGDVVSTTVTMSEATTVTGTPTLGLNIGGTTVQASYASGSGTNALVFNYTIVNGDVDTDGIGIAANSLALAGGTLKNAVGNNATLTHNAVAGNASFMVDTTAPAAPGLSLANDSGTSNSDGISNVSTINVSGLEAGASWAYQVGSGGWTTGTGTSFAATAGSNTYVVRQTDAAGNLGTASSAVTLNYDATAPAAPGLSLATDSGTLNSDGVTNVANINVSGLEAGASWQYRVGSGSWTTGSGTRFVATAGNNTYTVRQADTAGNLSATSTSVTLDVDNTAPTHTVSGVQISQDSGISASDFVTNSANQTITATLSGNLLGTDILEGSVDGGKTWNDITSSVGGVCVQVRASECLANGNCLSTPSCKPGQQNILGVCWNACPTSFNATAALCTQQTPTGWSDAGAFFFRYTSRRVCSFLGCTNVPIYETRSKSIQARSNAGLANQCPAGQTFRLGVCVRNDLNAYVRGQVASAGVAALATDSFVRPIIDQPTDEAFTVAVLSDPQLPWDETSDQAKSGRSTPDSVLTNSRAFNLNLVQSVNGLQTALQGTPSPLAFTVINGDLTAYFHPEQLSEFRAFYDKGFPWAYSHVLQSPVFLGLGNHDYENNLGSCQSFSWDKDRCTKNAINLIRGSVFAGYTKNMPANTIESYDAGSLAYSWNRGRYHFVQLHNGPNYKIDRLGVSTSIEWLRADLARAKARGQSIIINMHKPVMPMEFLQAIDGQAVVAIFAGHLHSSLGRTHDANTPSGQKVPVFLSGSADQQSFLKVNFEASKVRVTPMSSKGGQAVALGEPIELDASK